MENKSRIYWFEPFVFIFFGVLYLCSIWGLLDKPHYSNFWLLAILGKRTWYLILIGILSLLCIIGIIIFCKNFSKNYWWRWFYLLVGGCLLFNLFDITANLFMLNTLLFYIFDPTNPYWNIIYGIFATIGLLSFILGISITKRFLRQNSLSSSIA